MTAAISIDHVSKEYRLGTISAGTLHEDLGRWWARVRGRPDPIHKVDAVHPPRRTGDLFRALEDVTFDVPHGEVLGVIGPNGAGKSTLLKILSQVTAPSSGEVRLWGRVASLLEVGTGFHPDLTGRENIFLNGAILGMTKAEIRRNFDEIVAFSECEAFIDTPVKRYSSGMYVRLAFAVAAHLESEILIVDEVLAVGDAQFQKKCLGKMRAVSAHGRTILFVSHSMAAISALCTRAVLLRGGTVALHGETSRVVDAYQSERLTTRGERQNVAEMPRIGTGKGRFISLEMHATDASGRRLPMAVPGCDLHIETRVLAMTDFSDANVAIIVFDAGGYRVVDINTALGGEFLSLTRNQVGTVTFHATDVLLKPGVYYVGLWLGRGLIEALDYVEGAGSLDVREDAAATRHTQVFPGVYQCRFTHSLTVDEVGVANGIQGVSSSAVAQRP